MSPAERSLPLARPMVISSGEPAGIGPDICLMLAAAGRLGFSTVLGDPALLAERAAVLGLDVRIETDALTAPAASGRMHVSPVALARPAHAGRLDSANARYVLEMLDRAADGCREGIFAGMVTAPVHKGVINDAGIPFSGHTEYLAGRTNTDRVVMLLVAGNLRVALATTHLPLRQVPGAINTADLRRTLEILATGLRQRFGLPTPRISVLGLNPHAGEGGHLGNEELEVIEPVVRELTQAGLDLRGPLPADTAFTPRHLENTDAVLAMYHDQGLPVLKYAGFGEAVNVTLGLPIIRTSVDHGTALDIAATGRAHPDSLAAALALARQMAEQ